MECVYTHLVCLHHYVKAKSILPTSTRYHHRSHGGRVRQMEAAASDLPRICSWYLCKYDRVLKAVGEGAGRQKLEPSDNVNLRPNHWIIGTLNIIRILDHIVSHGRKFDFEWRTQKIAPRADNRLQVELVEKFWNSDSDRLYVTGRNSVSNWRSTIHAVRHRTKQREKITRT